MKRTLAICLSLTLLLSLCACSSGENDISPDAAPSSVSEDSAYGGTAAADAAFSDRDLDGSWQDASATYISLGDSPSINGGGASFDGGILRIRSGGIYVLSGSMSGCLVVEATKSDKLQIVLNGASISSADGPAVYIKKADKVFLTVADGTENELIDSKSYAPDDENPNAALYSKEDLSINGAGTLNITGNYKHGVSSKDDLVISNTTLNISSAGDGLRGKDCLKVKDARLNITSLGDGMQASGSKDALAGYMLLNGGSYSINSVNDGMQAASSLTITNGSYSIITGGGSAGAVFDANDSGDELPSSEEDSISAQASDAPSSLSDTPSAKGIKANGSISISGGSFELDCLDDGVHSGGDISFSPLSMSISSGDEGVQATGRFSMLGGELKISKSREGIEGKDIYFKNGSAYVAAFDDGVNAAGGADDSSAESRPPEESLSSANIGTIKIEGGALTVNAGGDGLDANRDIYISGGETTIYGPVDEENSAIDYVGKCEISGGSFAAAGSYGEETQFFTAGATQLSLIINYTETQKAGSGAFIKDANEKTLIGLTPEKDYELVIFSSPALKQNESYALYCGESRLAELKTGSSNAFNEKGEALKLSSPVS